MPSAAERGNNQFLKWRSRKKDVMLHYARGNGDRAWQELHDLMIFTNEQFQEIIEDKHKVDTK